MGRSPCCVKNGLKKGPWTVEEDKKLVDYIRKHGQGNWRTLPKNAGLNRCGKSCRLRWTNYLRPDIKRGQFTFEEEEAIIQLHSVLGNKWSVIAAQLAGRTDNEIKNYWNTHIKKRLLKMGIDPVTHTPCLNLLDLSSVLASSLHTHHYSQYINIPKSLNMSGYTLNPDVLDLATSLSPSNYKGAQMPQNVQETTPQAQDQFQYSLLSSQLHNPPNDSHFLNENRLMHNNNVREISPSNPSDFVSCNGNPVPSYWQADGQIHHQHMNLAETSVSVPNHGYDGSCQIFIDPFFRGHHVFQSNNTNRVHNYDLSSSSLSSPISSLEMPRSVQETTPQVQDQLRCSLLANQLHNPPNDFHFLSENRLMHANNATEISSSNPNDFVICNENSIPSCWQADGQIHRQYMNIAETSVSVLNHEFDSCRFGIDHFVSGHHVFQSNDTSKGQNCGLGSSSLSSAMSSSLALNAPSTPFLGSCDGEDRDGPGSHIVSSLYDAAPSGSFVNGIM